MTFRQVPSVNKPLSQRVSLGDEIYEAILQRLISLQIPPNEHISVDALVRELGVSQTPIRGALSRLEANGLVVRKHNSGFAAAPMPTAKRFQDLYELRLLLEPQAAALAAGRMSSQQRQKLADLNGRLAGLAKGDVRTGYGSFALIDAEFHDLVAHGSGNELIAESLARLYTHLHLFRLRLHSIVTLSAVREHHEIVAAIMAEDAPAAESAMREHIVESRKRMSPYFDLTPL